MNTPATYETLRTEIQEDRELIRRTLAGTSEEPFMHTLLQNLDEQEEAIDICIETHALLNDAQPGPTR